LLRTSQRPVPAQSWSALVTGVPSSDRSLKNPFLLQLSGPFPPARELLCVNFSFFSLILLCLWSAFRSLFRLPPFPVARPDLRPSLSSASFRLSLSSVVRLKTQAERSAPLPSPLYATSSPNLPFPLPRCPLSPSFSFLLLQAFFLLSCESIILRWCCFSVVLPLCCIRDFCPRFQLPFLLTRARLCPPPPFLGLAYRCGGIFDWFFHPFALALLAGGRTFTVGIRNQWGYAFRP